MIVIMYRPKSKQIPAPCATLGEKFETALGNLQTFVLITDKK